MRLRRNRGIIIFSYQSSLLKGAQSKPRRRGDTAGPAFLAHAQGIVCSRVPTTVLEEQATQLNIKPVAIFFLRYIDQ